MMNESTCTSSHRRRKRSNHVKSPSINTTTASTIASTAAPMRRNRPRTKTSKLSHSFQRHVSQCPLLIVCIVFQVCSLLHLKNIKGISNTGIGTSTSTSIDAFQQPSPSLVCIQHRLQQRRTERTDKFYHQTFINNEFTSSYGTQIRSSKRLQQNLQLQLQLLPSTKDHDYHNDKKNSRNGYGHGHGHGHSHAIMNFRGEKELITQRYSLERLSTQLYSSVDGNNDDDQTTTTTSTATTTATTPPTSSSSSTTSTSATKKPDVIEVPMPTEAGGYTHTSASRAKISAANRGKIPWNKGKSRSEETKARIAEGVRRKNRERFLKKLEDLGVTEEEYEQQKKEARRKKDAERRARKTANGGYRLTEETKAKISKVLKEKHARGEVKKREYNGPYRKGFTHSEETKQKIRESLKKKWSEDTEYQERMRESSKNNNSQSSRSKISKTLKEKWQDPAFREKMIKAMKENRPPKSAASEAQKAKISAAMKKKWQDADYRKRAMKGMEQYRDSLPVKPKKKKIVSKRAATIQVDDVFAVTPMAAGTKKKRRRTKAVKVGSTNAAKKKTKKKKKKKKATTVTLAKTAKATSTPKNGEKKNGKAKEKKDDGDISRMREERRDLYDLLYGDESEEVVSDEESFSPVIPDPLSESQNPAMAFFGGGAADILDDENLDDFDPYGLDDR